VLKAHSVEVGGEVLANNVEVGILGQDGVVLGLLDHDCFGTVEILW